MSSRPPGALSYGSGTHRIGAAPLEEGEVIVGFTGPRERVAAVTHVRSTLILGTLAALAELRLLDDYHHRLPTALRDEMRLMPAGTWLPLHVVLPHYEACEALQLTPMQAAELGGAIAASTQRMLAPAATRLHADAHTSPWSVLAQFHRYFRRFFLGGEVAVVRLGPRDGRIEMAGVPMAGLSHFRHGVRGVVSEALRGLLGHVLVKDIDRAATATSLALRIAWA